MDILLSHATALEALRLPRLRGHIARAGRTGVQLPETPPSRDWLDRLRQVLPELTPPVGVLVSATSTRVSNSRLITHVTRTPLPDGSAIPVTESILCISPEHLPVQLAPLLTCLELVFLISELLGTYAVAPDIPNGMFERPEPLTTPERMRAHLAALGPVPGTAQVSWALAQACVRSASPRETRLSMRLGLKPALGGYHLDVLSMNETLEVRRIGRSLAPGTRRPDVLLGAAREGAPFSGVAIDYHGHVHEEPGQLTRDLARQNELLAIDFKDYAIDRTLYHDLDYMDDLVLLIRGDLGLPRQRLSVAERRRRRGLRRWLHDELELIDGVRWEGRERERSAGQELTELVPVEAYGLV